MINLAADMDTSNNASIACTLCTTQWNSIVQYASHMEWMLVTANEIDNEKHATLYQARQPNFERKSYFVKEANIQPGCVRHWTYCRAGGFYIRMYHPWSSLTDGGLCEAAFHHDNRICSATEQCWTRLTLKH